MTSRVGQLAHSTPSLSVSNGRPSRSPSSTSASDAELSFDTGGDQSLELEDELEEEEEESGEEDDSDFLDVDDLTSNRYRNTSLNNIKTPATPKSNLGNLNPWPFHLSDAPEGSTSSEGGVGESMDHQPPLSPVLPSSPTLSILAPLPIPASSLPHEILLHILRLLPSVSLSPALLVCKAWCQCGVELLWHKPSFTKVTTLTKMLTVLDSPVQTFPYPSFVRRLNFSALQDDMSDRILVRLLPCERLERLTLGGCTGLSSSSIVELISRCERLVALDLTEVKEVDDAVVLALAKHCKKLQGLNLSGCNKVTDIGLEAVAKSCPAIRRIKLRRVELLTDVPIILLSLHCPLLLELDVVGCTHLTSLALQQLFRTSHHLRELSLQACPAITDVGFPDSSNYLTSASTSPSSTSLENTLLCSDQITRIPIPTSLRQLPSLKPFDHLRFLDLTSLTRITDASLAVIVKYMPRIRNLILAKCTGLTDEGILSICQLGKHLHYLHLGHVSAITDKAVTRLARACTRLRYIDLACCNNLTDMSVFELAANLPRLKRIGLVRVTALTDDAISALFVRTSLERIHLSYCDRLTINAITELLAHLPRLTHLSLTGVAAFRRADLQAFCRPPPRDFNSHQRASFCVYSGKGVQDLRRHLRALNAIERDLLVNNLVTGAVTGTGAALGTTGEDARMTRMTTQIRARMNFTTPGTTNPNPSTSTTTIITASGGSLQQFITPTANNNNNLPPIAAPPPPYIRTGQPPTAREISAALRIAGGSSVNRRLFPSPSNANGTRDLSNFNEAGQSTTSNNGYHSIPRRSMNAGGEGGWQWDEEMNSGSFVNPRPSASTSTLSYNTNGNTTSDGGVMTRERRRRDTVTAGTYRNRSEDVQAAIGGTGTAGNQVEMNEDGSEDDDEVDSDEEDEDGDIEMRD